MDMIEVSPHILMNQSGALLKVNLNILSEKLSGDGFLQ
jgi:hypothetical protein